MARVIILTKGTAGDLFPCLAAGRALNAHGHHVVLMSHFGYRAQAERAGLEFIPLDDAEEQRLFFNNAHRLNSARGSLSFFEQYCLPRTRREYMLLTEQCHKHEQTVLLTRHMATIADLLVAEKEFRPLVRLFTAVSQASTLGLLTELMNAFLTQEINRIRAKLGLQNRPDWYEFLRLPAANVGNWPTWFASGEQDFPIAVTPVGFLMHDLAESGDIPSRVVSFFASDRRPVLITAGTGDFVDSKFHSSAIEGCRLLGLRSVTVTRDLHLLSTVCSESEISAPSLPMAAVMPQVAAVIHHGGIGTIARAIASGVPQVVLAYGADRPDNAARLERLGVARHLRPPQWEPRTIAVSLDQLLMSAAVRTRCSVLSQRVRGEDAAQRLCKVVESVAGN